MLRALLVQDAGDPAPAPAEVPELPVARMPPRAGGMTRAAPPPDPDFEALLEHLRLHRGADFTGYKRASLMRLVDRRLAATGATDYRSYQDLLEADPGEFARLFDGLLVNVTSFFRDPLRLGGPAHVGPARAASRRCRATRRCGCGARRAPPARRRTPSR